jgi:hypothetical protein
MYTFGSNCIIIIVTGFKLQVTDFLNKTWF